jgi:Flp pilus assembly protein TadG
MTIDERVNHRSRAQRGAALLEFALVAILFFMLVFGIITYAYMMSFRSSLTQAAAEGARAGAVAPSGQAQTNAQAAVNRAMDGYGVTCGSPGMTCTIPAPAPCVNNTSRTCVTVTVSYGYRAHPQLPTFPGLGLTLPQTLSFTSVAEVN